MRSKPFALSPVGTVTTLADHMATAMIHSALPPKRKRGPRPNGSSAVASEANANSTSRLTAGWFRIRCRTLSNSSLPEPYFILALHPFSILFLRL